MSLSIGLIGNCHTATIAKALKFFIKDPKISLYPAADSSDVDRLVDAVRRHDAVICQFQNNTLVGSDAVALKERLTNLMQFPRVVFPAFHPDMMYLNIEGEAGEFTIIRSPVGQNHSKLTVFGYMTGLSPRQTVRLFNDKVFRALGYYDAWEPSRLELFAEAERNSISLKMEFLSWARRGCFMYTFNHPKMFVLGDITRVILENAGIECRAGDPSMFMCDRLIESTVWPVYPPIGSIYGIQGSYFFKSDDERIYNLSEFVEASFNIYKDFEIRKLRCFPVNEWLADEARVAFLRDQTGT